MFINYHCKIGYSQFTPNPSNKTVVPLAVAVILKNIRNPFSELKIFYWVIRNSLAKQIQVSNFITSFTATISFSVNSLIFLPYKERLLIFVRLFWLEFPIQTTRLVTDQGQTAILCYA